MHQEKFSRQIQKLPHTYKNCFSGHFSFMKGSIFLKERSYRGVHRAEHLPQGMMYSRSILALWENPEEVLGWVLNLSAFKRTAKLHSGAEQVLWLYHQVQVHVKSEISVNVWHGKVCGGSGREIIFLYLYDNTGILGKIAIWWICFFLWSRSAHCPVLVVYKCFSPHPYQWWILNNWIYICTCFCTQSLSLLCIKVLQEKYFILREVKP